MTTIRESEDFINQRALGSGTEQENNIGSVTIHRNEGLGLGLSMEEKKEGICLGWMY